MALITSDCDAALAAPLAVAVPPPQAWRGGARPAAGRDGPAALAICEAVILLHPPLPLAGVSIGTERELQQNDRTLANG